MHTTLVQDNLDFSSSFSFHQTVPIRPVLLPRVEVPEAFYGEGFAVVDAIASPEAARAYLEGLIASVDATRLPLYLRFAGRVQLASETCIPTCAAIVETTFQGLHFDMGLPITTPSPQVVQLLLALYRPLTGPYSQAATRVVPLRRLLSQRRWSSEHELETRVVDYANRHGDGWERPKRVNTYRLACLARLIDSADGSTDMIDRRDVATGLEFRDAGNDERRSLQNEYSFFEKHGMDVSAVERQVRLEPGQLLVVDNTRAAHGRVGKRREREMWHYLFGVPSASPEDIDEVRHEVLRQFI
ncbi:MAG: hypothetical protein Greene041619_688 [Candidatus Peregrinibacteria bacterium Greene0416_19]|nr:MAG: hypothetical protein Greene041619_688 [Candidatus Peregrinibacteria bacterium Greene0416_19]